MADNIRWIDIDAVAVRDVAGRYITEMGAKDDRVILVNADLAGSSRNRGFIEKYPERSFNVGIAEANMVSFAAGLAHEGYLPYCFTFGPFLSMRACEQVRTDVAYGQVPVRMVGNYAGYSGGISGATHCALEDCAIMCGIDGMTVLEPGDPYQIVKMLEASLSYKGPIYIRIGRESEKPIYTEDYDYQIGKALIPHTGDDGAFIASGLVVQFAMEAAQRLEEDLGAHVRVVDMHTIKPLDIEAVVDAAKTGNVICAQDHNIYGGLGTYVGKAIAESGIATNFQVLGCPDYFVPIATTEYLFHKNGYDTDGLYQHMRAMLSR